MKGAPSRRHFLRRSRHVNGQDSRTDGSHLLGRRDTVWSVRSRRFLLVAFHISILPRETLGLVGSFEKFVLSHFTGREGGMTTVWRPRVRIAVPDIDGADADENRRDELTKKGTKRKRAPMHYGPCEHGVKTARSARCAALVRTVVSALTARSAVGIESASTVVSALSARSAVGHQYASTVVGALVQGVRWVTNMRARSSALSVQGVRWCINLRARSSALSVQGVRWVINLRARS